MSDKRHASSSKDSLAKLPGNATSKSATSTKTLKPKEQYVYVAVEIESLYYDQADEHFFKLFASKEDANRRLEVRLTERSTENEAFPVAFEKDDWEIEYDEFGCFHAIAYDSVSFHRFDVSRMKVYPEGSVSTAVIEKEREDKKLGRNKSHKSKQAGDYDLDTGEEFSDHDRS